MNRAVAGTAVLVGWLAADAANAQEVRGFAELRGQAYVGVDGTPVAVVERVRPEFSAMIGERLRLSTTVELLLVQGRSPNRELERTFGDAGLAGALDASGYERRTHANDVLRVSDASDYLAVERLYLDVYLPWLDLRVGRQAVNWGSAYMVNPTDPFPEVLLLDPWRLRSGVNALRATVPIGDRHQVQLVAASDDAFLHPRLAGRVTLNYLETDFSLVGAWREDADDGIAGVNIRGTLVVGFWIEAAAHITGAPYEEFAVGIDYSFAVLDTLAVTAQYYRNGSGSPRLDSMSVAGGLTGESGDDPFGPFFRGRDYLMASISLAFTPELSTAALWVQNLGDGSGLVVPTIKYATASGLEIAASAQIPVSVWGSGGELRPSGEDLTLAIPDESGTLRALDLSGLAPDATITLWARFYF